LTQKKVEKENSRWWKNTYPSRLAARKGVNLPAGRQARHLA
jgi:hypothetical protein